MSALCTDVQLILGCPQVCLFIAEPMMRLLLLRQSLECVLAAHDPLQAS